jgi:hypothetical protein
VHDKTWDQLDEGERLKLKNARAVSAAQKLQGTTSKESAKAQEEEAKRDEQRRAGSLFDSSIFVEPEPEDDEELGRVGSFISDTPTVPSSCGSAELRSHVDQEGRNRGQGQHGKVLRAQWKGSEKVAIKVALGSAEDIKQ